MKLVELPSLISPILELMSDLAIAERMLDKDDSQYARRVYIRALLSTIEGTIYVLKQIILKVNSSSSNLLLYSEIAMLQEVSYELSNKGEVKETTKLLRIEDNIRFTTKILNKVFHFELALQVGEKSWEHFLQAIKIRNRITHPKGSDHFKISDDEIQVVRHVSNWFLNFTNKALKCLEEVTYV